MAKYQQLDAQGVSAVVKAAVKSAGATHQAIQRAAVQCIGHAIAHGDIRPANDLLNGLGKSVRKQGLVVFFETHGPFAFSTADKALVYFKREVGFDGNKLMAIDWASSVPPEVIKSSIDVADELEKLLKRVSSAADKAAKAGVEFDVKGSDLATTLGDLLAKYRSDEYEPEVELPAVKAA
ncbi:hypothetical protein [Paraburkholderia unamae]|uniref:Uncharacterized protein n=1 Tax=Paraburkholderia unamae TaxID=219649 RepID=A0ACC6RGP0_9BURK